jgi:UV DNA damage repair endonuclease
MSNRYDKMDDYIKSIFNVFQMVNRKAEQQQDKRFKMIGLTIYNYARYMSKEYDINLKDINETEYINLIPIFEYVAANNIELLDFSNININDIDITKKEDLEKFVLSHVYYITQCQNNI